MRKNVIAIIISVFIMMLSVVGTGCGDGMNGTWYYINGASDNNLMNLTFQDNHEVINTGLIGEYSVDGDYVTVCFLGVQETYERAQHEGEDILVKNGRPVYAKTLEGAEKIASSE